MFGPNVSRSVTLTVDFHHREPTFISLFQETRDTFRSKFSIPDNYVILFFSGSGTMALEAFASSFKGSFAVKSEDLETEKFAHRMKSFAERYGKYDPNSSNFTYVQYETSQSKYNQPDPNATFVDCVSSFPYWPAPKAPVWVTVSSKMLAAMPVISIMVVDEQFLLENFEPAPGYLNPLNYYEYQKRNQTPFTPSIPLFTDFNNILKGFSVERLQDQVNSRFEMFREILGDENLSNRDVSPVMTIPRGVISEEIVSKWSLYGCTTQQPIQLFLYSESDKAYDELARDIRNG
jgi:aspartate aminotransferase-like enzyme